MIVITKNKLKNYWHCYLLIIAPLILVLIFNYYPIFNGFIHIFYRWNGDNIEEFIGMGNFVKMFHDTELWRSFVVVGIFIVSNLIKMIPPIITAVVLHHIISSRIQYFYRVLFVIPMIVPAIVGILIWKYYYEPNTGFINAFLRTIGILGPAETIQWLTNIKLVIPSLIFAGFPWVGAFGVLIYLSGLSNISKEIYEAADIDGAGPIRVFWCIEVPLIMTQIRINLILMIIGTIQSWQNVYLYLGESGGPGGIATVPGLLIFREAFAKGFFGYGCAIGFLLFLLTLLLTWVNNRYVRVKK
ncbi:MAG: sugar ABC transporter permease [Phycisphaerae bacterium]|jgi:raffinose/stachyose/melibiose transport system permease protein